MPPHVPYKNHYSRGIFQEQVLLSIWSISLSKWLNSGDKRKEAHLSFLILPIAGIEPVTYALRVRCSTD